jgi:hypothetical protein
MSEPTLKKSKWRSKYRNLKRQQEREEFKGWVEDDFISHILEIRDELDALQQKYDALNTVPKPANDIPTLIEKTIKAESFNQEWAYSTKFVFLLALENRPLKSIEIHNHLLKLDKHYKFYSDPKSTLSVYLRTVTKSNRIKSVKIPGIKEIYFAMPEWVNKEGNIKEEFDYVFNQFQ